LLTVEFKGVFEVSLCKSKVIADDFIVLTPNHRLAKIVGENYCSQNRAEKKKVWTPRTALSFHEWVLALSQTFMQKELLTPRLFLSLSQLETIWAQLIGQKNESLSHFSSLALQAWSLSHQWGISFYDPLFLQSETSKIWQSWALKFQTLLYQNQWCDPQTALLLTLQLIEKSETYILRDFLPRQIILTGFTQLNVFEKKILDALKKHNIRITEEHFTKIPLFCAKKSFDSEESELEALAQWAHEKSALGSVGCVIPRLSSMKNKVTAIFERYIENKDILNISPGNPLDVYPLIQAAFTGIALLDENLSIQTISDFLLSPFYHKSLSQLSGRSLLDSRLKSKLSLISNKAAVLDALKHTPLKIFFKPTLSSDIRKHFREWQDFFASHLHFLGWPGERVLSSEEFQLLSHWEQLLENFAGLSLVSGQASFSDALKKLKYLAKEMIFQPERSTAAKIDILGILEASGLPFDYLWIAGLEENTWPARGTPNPFLPLSLQKKLNMPHAGVEQDVRFCELITRQLLSSANEIIVSYPQMSGGNAVMPSALIADIPEINFPLPVATKIAEKNKITVEWEKLEDIQALPIDPENAVAAGSEIFKDQAACPFRAYARHRLKAKKIDLPQLGFKALTRGQWVHKVLEKFFQKIPDQHTLNVSEPADLYNLLETIIQQTVETSENTIFTLVEKKRLFQLVINWLSQEKKRDFFTVIATEKTLTAHLGKLPLSLRIDRIDHIGNEKYLIIDYKTGKMHFNPDNIDDEPQLPLYCVVSAINVESIGFAQLRQDEMKFKLFPAQKSVWESALLKLADDYLSGHAAVKPKYGQKTCRNCDLTALCRIKEILYT
jgi:ATP-dependent helicase/nuclease subunit B